MTTQEFISNEYGVTGRVKHCSSVFKDEDGNIYSYGYHYPLLFKVDGLDYINTRGYSSTTARHILWAKRANRWAIDVELKRDDRLPLDTSIILERLEQERQYTQNVLDQLKRKDTKKYRAIENELNDVEGRIARVKDLRG